MQQSTQNFVASFLKQLSKNLKSAPCNDYDLIVLIPEQANRQEFAKNIATYYEDEEILRELEEDSEFDPTMNVDWMVAEYLAYLLDGSNRRSREH